MEKLNRKLKVLVPLSLLFLISILFIPLVSSLTPPSGGVSYYNFSSTSDLWSSNDLDNNGASSSSDYPSFSVLGDSSPSSYSFSSDYLNSSGLWSSVSSQGVGSVNVWVKSSTDATSYFLMPSDFSTGSHSGLIFVTSWGGTGAYPGFEATTTTTDLSQDNRLRGDVRIDDGSWHMVTWLSNGTKNKIYVDGVQSGIIVEAGANQGFWFDNIDVAIDNFNIGGLIRNSGNTLFYTGLSDELSFYDFALNSTNISDLYETGRLNVSSVVVGNQSLESTATFHQLGVVNVLSTSYVTVVNGTFDIDNKTSVYGSYNVEVDNRLVTNLSCRSLIDGVELDSEVVRTFDGTNILANLAIYTTNKTVDVGSHWAAVQCKKNLGTSFFEVANTDAIIHILVNDEGENLSFSSFSINVSTSSSSYVLLGSVNFTTSNVTLGGKNISLIFEGSINYDYVSESNISFFAEVEGVNTSAYSRFGVANSRGSGAGLYIINDASPNSNVTFNLYGKSSSGDGGAKVNVVIKEFITDVNETDISSASGTAITTSWSKINMLFLNNSDHVNANAVVKSVNSYVSTSGTQTLSLMIGNDAANGTVMQRTINDNQEGVIYLQEVFDSIGVGDHNFYLWAMTSSGSAVLSNGSTIAYITDNIPFSSTSYEVRAFDSWDNSSISVFNVTDSLGTIFEATIGVVNVTPTAFTGDLIINSIGYFNAAVLNHNTSNDLNVTLNQSIIYFQGYESLSNNSISGITYEVTDGVVTQNTSSFLNLKNGSYNVTTYKIGFLSTTQSFSVSPLDVKTIRIYNMSDANVTIVPRTIISNTSLSGLNITISYGGNFFYFSNVSNVTVPLIANQTYQLMIDGVNISLYNESFSTSSIGDVTEYVYVYYFNSLWVYAFSQDSLVNISSFNVTVQNDAYQYQNSTTSYITYFDNIMSGVYTVLVSSVGYVTNEYTITIDDNAHQNLFAYLANTTNIVTFTVTSKSSSKLVEDALVTQKKFISGVLTTISSAQSNIVGQVSFAYEPDVIYTFVVTKPTFVTKTFTLAPSPIDYTILLETFTTLNPSVFVDDVYTQLYDSNIKNVVSAEVRALFSSGGQLTNYYLNMSFDGDYDYVSSSSATGSLLTSSLNLSGATIGDVVLVEYGYKSSVNSAYVTFSKTYIINTWTNVDVSFDNSRDYFADYGYLEKVIMATLIAMFFAAIFSAGAGLSSTDLLIGASLGGFFGFGLSFYFGLITGAVFMSVSFIFILVIITNLRGSK